MNETPDPQQPEPEKGRKENPPLSSLPTSQLIDTARATHARLLRAGLPYLRDPKNFRDGQSRRVLPRLRLHLGAVMDELKKREPQAAAQLESELTQNFEQGVIRCRKRNRGHAHRYARRKTVFNHRENKARRKNRKGSSEQS